MERNKHVYQHIRKRYGPFVFIKQKTIVPSKKKKWYMLLWIAYGNIEIHAVTFLFFFKFVYDIILFERCTFSSILLRVFMTQWAHSTYPPLKFLSCQQM